MARPDWWEWELEISSHAEKRMLQRGLTEIELRELMSMAELIVADSEPGRWMIRASLGTSSWTIIAEPDPDEKLIVVVTTYRHEG